MRKAPVNVETVKESTPASDSGAAAEQLQAVPPRTLLPSAVAGAAEVSIRRADAFRLPRFKHAFAKYMEKKSQIAEMRAAQAEGLEQTKSGQDHVAVQGHASHVVSHLGTPASDPGFRAAFNSLFEKFNFDSLFEKFSADQVADQVAPVLCCDGSVNSDAAVRSHKPIESTSAGSCSAHAVCAQSSGIWVSQRPWVRRRPWVHRRPCTYDAVATSTPPKKRATPEQVAKGLECADALKRRSSADTCQEPSKSPNTEAAEAAQEAKLQTARDKRKWQSQNRREKAAAAAAAEASKEKGAKVSKPPRDLDWYLRANPAFVFSPHSCYATCRSNPVTAVDPADDATAVDHVSGALDSSQQVDAVAAVSAAAQRVSQNNRKRQVQLLEPQRVDANEPMLTKKRPKLRGSVARPFARAASGPVTGPPEADTEGDLTVLGFSTGDGQLRASDEEWSVLQSLQARLREFVNDQAVQVKGEVTTVKTDDVYFIQRDISPTLRNTGMTVTQLTQEICDGRIDPLETEWLVLDVMKVLLREHHGPRSPRRLVYLTLDHRRLKAMKDAGCPEVKVCIFSHPKLSDFANKASIALKSDIGVNRSPFRHVRPTLHPGLIPKPPSVPPPPGILPPRLIPKPPSTPPSPGTLPPGLILKPPSMPLPPGPVPSPFAPRGASCKASSMVGASCKAASMAINGTTLEQRLQQAAMIGEQLQQAAINGATLEQLQQAGFANGDV
eukprot:gnl/TRDRNA2_/TRDRNA2_174378_c2_seq2.p1 gnl/TRDRNA2_/TRDRNA2_174378_c2~~gnl/TRDRNA2_/TRDRNA2_174378_c2_seq2.p1  ORF type:complete len:725 (+),score=117.24 gnl/TRDRNA2_/TRDRNA2_174378_c2_seq2:103-2277(+)